MLLSLILFFSHAMADEPSHNDTTIDYVDIKKGEVAKFDGKVFTNEGLAKLLAGHQEKIEEQKANHQFDIEKTKLDYQLKYDLLESKRAAEIEMYTSMINIRDEQIKKNARNDAFQRWAIYGGFVLGSASAIAIFYSVQ